MKHEQKQLLEQNRYKLDGLLKESKLFLSHEPDYTDVEYSKHITSGNL